MHDYRRVMRRLDALKRKHRGKTFTEGIGDLKTVISRHFACGQSEWNAADVYTVMGCAADMRDRRFIDLLKVWETHGYIRIFDTPKCLFRVLKRFN
ncbi:MAG: hypothetical protein FGM27_04530 [Candidatus Omnitrophica bacterium]|nr:hypothetical protein [Candidatus Omnitrophota bacterium]